MLYSRAPSASKQKWLTDAVPVVPLIRAVSPSTVLVAALWYALWPLEPSDACMEI
jgi:hypothetical protein